MFEPVPRFSHLTGGVIVAPFKGSPAPCYNGGLDVAVCYFDAGFAVVVVSAARAAQHVQNAFANCFSRLRGRSILLVWSVRCVCCGSLRRVRVRVWDRSDQVLVR